MTPEDNLIIQTAKVSDTVLSATQSLIRYLEGHTTKTEVVNQLESIHTPDVQYVVEALQVLDKTLQTHENTDLTEITGVMRELLSEAKQIPKELPEETDYTKQLSSLLDAIQAVERVVKAQKLVAEAPIVNVPETNVHVDAPDLQPLQQGFKDVVKAVNGIAIPETDTTAVEKLLKESNKILDKLLKKPVSSGGGGGGTSWPAVGSNDNPVPLKVDGNGGLQTVSLAYATRIDDVTTTNITYIGRALPGTATSSATWQIQKIDETSGTIITWADGNGTFDNIWDSRVSLSYS